MKLQFKLMLAAIASLALLAPATMRADDLVANGNFSSGLTDWTYNTGSSNFFWTPATVGGATYASNACFGSSCITGPMSGQDYLYQNLATVAGDTYTLTFDYAPGIGKPNQLKVLFGGTTVDNLLNLSSTLTPGVYTISGLVATSNSTQLEFLGRQDPGASLLTGVDVSTVTPEPSSLLLLGTGLAGLAGSIMWRKRMEA